VLQYNELAKSPLLDRRDPDDRARLLKAIERKGIEWALTFDAIEFPIFLASSEGIVVRMNRAARDLAGGTYASILGRNIASLGDGELWRSLDDLVHAVLDARDSCTARAIDDHARHWDITCNLCEAEGEERLILILRDITRIVALQESVQRGEQLAALGELVAGVAHEVRNPLFGMMVTLDAYEPLVKQSEDAEEMFSSLRLWIHRLNQLMEDLLQYGKSWQIELVEGDLGDVIQQAIAQSQPEASKANVRVTKKLEPALRMLMDGDRLTHAVQNAIMNGIQHSDPGMEVEVAACRRDGGVIECAVRDHGPGFPATDLAKIFQPFFTRRRGGTGLGLSIAHRVIEEHGGTVAAENAAGGGAVVRMRFPEYNTAGEAKA